MTGCGPCFARSAATHPARLAGIVAQKEVIVNADLQNRRAEKGRSAKV